MTIERVIIEALLPSYINVISPGDAVDGDIILSLYARKKGENKYQNWKYLYGNMGRLQESITTGNLYKVLLQMHKLVREQGLGDEIEVLDQKGGGWIVWKD